MQNNIINFFLMFVPKSAIFITFAAYLETIE
jgi:hypothetical protein